MPSPFPGMDPYLEDTEFWKGFHNSLLFCIMENLQPRLLPRYVATTKATLLLQPLDQPEGEPRAQLRLPDVAIRERQSPVPPGAGAVLVADPPLEATEPLWIDEPELHQWHAFLEIRSLPDRRVVTVIEVLSPTNKLPGDGRDQYRQQQRELLLSRTNLVEIDLLRGGAHTVAFRPGSVSPSEYRVCTYRGALPTGFAVIPFGLRDPLPRIGIPLRSEDPDVVLDLPAAFGRVYDTGAYFALLDYAASPGPSLVSGDAAWAEALLRTARLRGAPPDVQPDSASVLQD